MSISTEVIYSALFDLMTPLNQSNGGVCSTVSRRIQMVDEMQPGALPAAFQMQEKQKRAKVINKPPVYTLPAAWFLYSYQPDPSAAPSVLLNQMIDLATMQFVPAGGQGKFTLGGLVEDCFINGDVEIYEGVLGDRAVAVIPIQIIVPGW